MKLHFVADGPRDYGVMPRLVEGILDTTVAESSAQWARLHNKGKGLDRKLRYSVLQAKDHDASGLIATVDVDVNGQDRLPNLRKARKALRDEGEDFPIALGAADPYAEVWLLDDHVAVREGLRLKADAAVPSVRDVASPKRALEQLMRESPRSEEEPKAVFSDIAKALDPGRCAHAKETGFKAFQRDVVSELKPRGTTRAA